MFEKLINIAKNEFEMLDENLPIPKGLPTSQVVVLCSKNGNVYTTINDINGEICEKLIMNNDTKIVSVVCMWKNGQIDLPSYEFRNKLINLDICNNDTEIFLKAKDSIIIKKIAQTM